MDLTPDTIPPQAGDLLVLPLTDPVPPGWTADHLAGSMWTIYTEGAVLPPAPNGECYVLRSGYVFAAPGWTDRLPPR